MESKVMGLTGLTPANAGKSGPKTCVVVVFNIPLI